MKIFKERNFKYLGREGTLILMSGVQNKSPLPFLQEFEFARKERNTHSDECKGNTPTSNLFSLFKFLNWQFFLNSLTKAPSLRIIHKKRKFVKSGKFANFRKKGNFKRQKSCQRYLLFYFFVFLVFFTRLFYKYRSH